jgi:hypothetical protein
MTTSTTQNQELRRELLLTQAVARHQDALVRLATKAVLKLINDNSQMKTSQLRNAVSVAQQEGASYDLVANFIRYKIATQGGAWGKSPESFGHTVIDHLGGNVREEVRNALTWLRNQPNFEALPHQDDLEGDLYSLMLKRYMGYLVRSFAYYEKADDKKDAAQKLKEAAQ